ncbi:MAG: YcgN family cysteine cluster protein [Pseudomonadota bacterium]
MSVVEFWKTKALSEMTEMEWESLCDGCGRCCLNKLEDWDTGEIHYTNIACSLFDESTCRCSNYPARFSIVPDCIKLEPQDISGYSWLPPTCAYRRLDEGKSLPDWHPLITGDPNSVHQNGISVLGKTIPEQGLTPEDFENHLVDWPNVDPFSGKNSSK